MLTIDCSLFSEALVKEKSLLLADAQQALASLKNGDCVGAAWTGWFDFPKKAGFALADEVQAYQRGLDFEYDVVVVVGIGGSYLGTRAVAEALGTKIPVVYAGNNLANGCLAELLQFLEDRQPLINVISKSGTTTEPAVAFRVLREALASRYSRAELAERIIATTDPHRGALRELGKSQGYKLFPVPEDMGGRFSVLSAVGLVPLALAGVDTDALLKGADSVFASLRTLPKAHACLDYAAARTAAYRSGKSVELLATATPKLHNLAEWWKQLFGESEGKAGKGLLPTSVTYTTDLHSLGQYVQDGARILFETFLNCRDDGTPAIALPRASDNLDELRYLEGKTIAEINRAAIAATKLAHADGGVPCLDINAGPLNATTLGELIAFFESSCAISAGLLGVNPYDQPGVEDYKKNLFALMRKPGFEHLAEQLQRRLK